MKVHYFWYVTFARIDRILTLGGPLLPIFVPDFLVALVNSAPRVNDVSAYYYDSSIGSVLTLAFLFILAAAVWI